MLHFVTPSHRLLSVALMQMLLARTVAVLYNAAGVTQNLEVSDLHQSKASEEQEEQSMMGLVIGFDEAGLTWMEIL